MLSSKNVSIILVSYKSRTKILNFLKNISENYKIIIIENSYDKILKSEIEKKYKNVEIYLRENSGYGASVNYARTKIKTKYFFLLNPDIYGVNDHIIDLFYQKANELNDNFSCLGPRYNELKNIKQSDKNKEINKFSISGSAMFFCIKTFDLLNGFDENFFLYFEENDYCKRGAKIKVYSYQINSILLKHDIGTSVEYYDKDEKENYMKLYNWHFMWSKGYYMKKHYGIILAIIYFLPLILKYNLYLILYKMIDNKKKFLKFKDRICALLLALSGKKANKRIH